MNEKHCDECGKLISYGLLYGKLHFCNDECTAAFGIDPRDCVFGEVHDTIDYLIGDDLAAYYVYYDS